MKMGIKAKILVIMLVVAFVPGIVGVSSTYLRGSQVFKKALGQKFVEMNRQISVAIRILIEQKGSEARFIASNNAVREALLTGSYSEEATSTLALSRAGGGASNAGLYEADGTIFLKLNERANIPPLDYRVADIFKDGAEKYVLGNPIRSKNFKGALLPVYAPIYDGKKGALIGIIALFIDIDGYFAKAGSVYFGEGGHVNLVAASGAVIFDPYMDERASFPEATMARIKENREQWFVSIDEHGSNSVIVASAPVYPLYGDYSDSNKDWYYIVLTQPIAEAFLKPINDVLFGAAIPGFIFAVILICIIYLTLKKIVGPIGALKEGAALIAGGNLDHRILIHTGDEIEDLANEFNNMTSELESLYHGLEEKVRERTVELEESNRELEKANRLKSEFLANISHELRTPLNSIIGFSEVLQDGLYGEINDKQGKYLGNIHKSGKHLLELINSILDLSKIEAGRMEFHPEEISFRDAAKEVENVIKPLAIKKGIDLKFFIEDTLDEITADRLKLKQILYNLLGNAIKFTPDKGSVALEAKKEGAFIKVAVKDTGIGIKEEELDLIFESFRQADGSHSRDFEGTGLGLTLTRKFIDMHGGQIRAESVEGEGSSFIFTLPLKYEE
ncbi:MAG: ATP-binding protein [bacterium]|nr:ATP-binding protein [bacterium]